MTLTCHKVMGHGGVNLKVYEAGPKDAPPLMLVHGWSQCHLSWEKQQPLVDEFRLIMMDLRGHGASDKPDDPKAYDNSQPWADDIDAIISALDLRMPVLVGWSMGGWVVMDYLRVHRDLALSGAGFVGSTLTPGSKMPAHLMALRQSNPAVRAKGMFSDDLSENLAATLDFVRACFHRQPEADELSKMVGFNMMVPPHIRGAARGRSEDYRPTAATTKKPIFAAWGAKERVVPTELGEHLAAAFPNVQTHVYDNCGHAPFWEEPDKFNDDLSAFTRACHDRHTFSIPNKLPGSGGRAPSHALR